MKSKPEWKFQRGKKVKVKNTPESIILIKQWNTMNFKPILNKVGVIKEVFRSMNYTTRKKEVFGYYVEFSISNIPKLYFILTKCIELA